MVIRRELIQCVCTALQPHSATWNMEISRCRPPLLSSDSFFLLLFLAVFHKERSALWLHLSCPLPYEQIRWLWMGWSRNEEKRTVVSSASLSIVLCVQLHDQWETRLLMLPGHTLQGCEDFQLLCCHCFVISPSFCLWDKTRFIVLFCFVFAKAGGDLFNLGDLFNHHFGNCSPKRVHCEIYYSFSSNSYPSLGNLCQQHLAFLSDFFDYYTDVFFAENLWTLGLYS